MLCGAGYRVLMPNPRGSAAFGVAWTRAVRGRWGEVDTADVMAALDTVVARGMAVGAAIAYLAFATAFGGETFRLIGAIGIIVLGLALVAGGLAERLSRKGSG